MKDANARYHDEAQLQAILDRLDSQESEADFSNRRTFHRHGYRRHPVNLRVIQPGGGIVTCSVAGREISASGMSFLYRGFLYPGTDVRIHVRRRTGGEEVVDSAVVWCKHIVGPHHLIGVKFRQRIYPRLFVESAAMEDEAGETIDPAKLSGNLLFIDDQDLDRMLFEHHIKRSAMKLTCVADGEAAVQAVKTGEFHVIVCDLNLGEMRGEALIKQFRAAGCKAPIIALTAESSPARLQAAQDSGAQAIVQKPYDPLMLLAVIAGMLTKPIPAEGPIHSDMAGDPVVDALILQCVEKVRDIVVQLKSAIEAEDLAHVRNLCQILKGSGGGFGFSSLTEAAKCAVTMLDASMSVPESIDELHQLESVCKRLATGKATATK